MANDIQIRIDQLKAEQANCLAAVNSADTTIAELLRQQNEGARALDEAIRAALRTGDDSLEKSARDRLDGIDVGLESARARKRLAHDESGRIEAEIGRALIELQLHFKEKSRPLIEKVESRVRGNKSVRADLIEALALAVVAENGIGWAINWAGHLESIFAEPTGDEYHAAITAAKKTLGIE